MESLSATASTRLTAAKRVVIKVGSALLVDQSNGALRTGWLAGLAADIARLQAAGKAVIVVSSGAIALGRARLGLPAGPLALENAQAAAAVGQASLLRAWEDAIAAHDLKTAQVLLTLEDTQNRRRYLNARATLAALMDVGAVPVVNENDTVATDEIRYGDNDRLAARVALMADADLLVLLSDIDGLYTADPRQTGDAAHIPFVQEITPDIEAMGGGTGSAAASGGMRTKLLAAKTAMQGGCAMVVTRGDVDAPISAMTAGARSTWFLPSTEPAAARKQWIAGMKPMGTLTIDDGAIDALRRGKSLLPAGVREISGDFQRGDPVAINGPGGASIGAALVGYGAADAARITGRRLGEIGDILGYPGRAAMAHADDIVVWTKERGQAI